MTKLPIFKLENYLSEREFTSPYQFGSSDAESWKLSEILAMADPECKKLWDNLWLGYTETKGHPLLLQEIAKQYNDRIQDDNLLCFAGAQEGIYAACQALLSKDDHAITITPCYQSLESIPATICSLTTISLSHDNNWELNLEDIQNAIQDNTKIIFINYPHNPTGALLSHKQQLDLIEIAKKNNIWIFSDEVYRYLELDPKDRLEPFANLYDKAISLCVMSKSFGLPGIRIGWIAMQDKEALAQISEIKHYLSICNSAPAEILALIALRNIDTMLERQYKIIHENLKHLEPFISKHSNILEWVKPKGGCIAFPKIKLNMSSFDFCEKLRLSKGVVTLPSSVYGMKEAYLRIGFGRKNMLEALEKTDEYLSEIASSNN